jgi:hypothetical protein
MTTKIITTVIAMLSTLTSTINRPNDDLATYLMEDHVQILQLSVQITADGDLMADGCGGAVDVAALAQL